MGIHIVRELFLTTWILEREGRKRNLNGKVMIKDLIIYICANLRHTEASIQVGFPLVHHTCIAKCHFGSFHVLVGLLACCHVAMLSWHCMKPSFK